jgi:hypothetical protein
MTLICLLTKHKWNGCKCFRCGKSRDEGHKWSECECQICGKTRADLQTLYSILITQPSYISRNIPINNDSYFHNHRLFLGSKFQQIRYFFPDGGFMPNDKVVQAIGEHDDPSAIPIVEAAYWQARLVKDHDVINKSIIERTL